MPPSLAIDMAVAVGKVHLHNGSKGGYDEWRTSQAVCSPDTPVEALVAIKSVAKRLAVAAEAPTQDAAATLLYHLSVASAPGHHSQDISSKSLSERLPLYKDLAADLSDDQLAAIFEKGVARLPSTKP